MLKAYIGIVLEYRVKRENFRLVVECLYAGTQILKGDGAIDIKFNERFIMKSRKSKAKDNRRSFYSIAVHTSAVHTYS